MKCPYTEAVQQLRNRRKIWPPSSVISLSSQSNFMVCAALALLSASMYNKNTVLSFTCHDLQLHTMHGYVIVVSSFWGVWLNLLNPPGYRPAIFYARYLWDWIQVGAGLPESTIVNSNPCSCILVVHTITSLKPGDELHWLFKVCEYHLWWVHVNEMARHVPFSSRLNDSV